MEKNMIDGLTLRAWHKELKVMCEVRVIRLICPDGEPHVILYNDQYLSMIRVFLLSEVEIDRGLEIRDNNGQMIFENDIVQVVEETISHGDQYIRGVVRYMPYFAQWVISFTSCDVPISMYIETGIEVVGHYHNRGGLLPWDIQDED